jgi:hypothetical protein
MWGWGSDGSTAGNTNSTFMPWAPVKSPGEARSSPDECSRQRSGTPGLSKRILRHVILTPCVHELSGPTVQDEHWRDARIAALCAKNKGPPITLYDVDT